jgi:hypothetical protein
MVRGKIYPYTIFKNIFYYQIGSREIKKPTMRNWFKIMLKMIKKVTLINCKIRGWKIDENRPQNDPLKFDQKMA